MSAFYLSSRACEGACYADSIVGLFVVRPSNAHPPEASIAFILNCRGANTYNTERLIKVSFWCSCGLLHKRNPLTIFSEHSPKVLHRFPHYKWWENNQTNLYIPLEKRSANQKSLAISDIYQTFLYEIFPTLCKQRFSDNVQSKKTLKDVS